MNYRTSVIKNLSQIPSEQWESLRHADFNQPSTPFLSFEYLRALEITGCACENTGWSTQFLTLWDGDKLVAATPLYAKTHSYGEYVFDWSWANAYAQHGLSYYPKLLAAIPFTPVTGPKLMASDEKTLDALIKALSELSERGHFSSCHVLFISQQLAIRLQNLGYLLRQGVQFHWENQGYQSFEEFLTSLDRKKRKNIVQERRKVQSAGLRFEHKVGADISKSDWGFFNQCYQNTYFQHGGTGYLNLAFFLEIHRCMPDNILLIIAYRDDTPIAASLLFKDQESLYGRYWGSVEYHPCLHFETCYYQPLEYCIQHKIRFFEGGAQGEHKLARGFLPEPTYSAHFIQHPNFREAIERFLEREQRGMVNYIDELNEHSPFQQK